jgi:uncharacterized protein (TIGR01777 family)
MNILLTGGTGFIGAPLCRRLAQRGHAVAVLTRSPHRAAQHEGPSIVPFDAAEWRSAVEGADAVVNLAGEPIAARRWTPAQKRRIQESRVQTTRRLVDAIAASSRKPSVLISASATGFYGARGDEPLTEADPPGTGFLAETCQAWEDAATRAEPLGIRVVRLRIGVVLGRGGGALAKMAPPFLACVGGTLGHGRQWMSWVHLEDVLGLIEWALAHPELSGAVNATAPEPVTMAAFCRQLGRALRRPCWAPVPALVLRAVLGEMAQMLLTGQRVLPEAALRAGYAFRYPSLPAALDACFMQRSNPL